MATQAYEKTASNTVKRKGTRGRYDTDFIHGMINKTAVCHVSFLPDPSEPMPIILPMIGKVGLFEASGDEEESIYLHGYVSSRIMRLADEAVKQGQEGLPVCIAATKVDGLVLALTPFNHSYDYRSAVVQGHAVSCDDQDEKLWAMELITNGVIPDRWENSRVPDKADMQSTRILKVKIDTASGKVRTGPPGDDRKDMNNEDVLNSVWTGVVPVYETYGEPRESSYNRVQTIPSHVGDYVKTQSKALRDEAMELTKS
ncbi:MAG: hypothetical protein M1828_006074 [Chrysothrix sp. TS-e1954]|nr:MAG: hypothetical protein M1828_006074 [Chrysothrix sp. TS-e1954]